MNGKDLLNPQFDESGIYLDMCRFCMPRTYEFEERMKALERRMRKTESMKFGNLYER